MENYFPVTGGYPGPPLVTIADASFGPDWYSTPGGLYPLRNAQLNVSDLSRTESRTPTWAIVLAVLGFLFFLLGLLFLLVKEQVTTGVIQVTIHNGQNFHTTAIPVNSPQAVADVHGRVNYVRQLVSFLG